MCEKEMDFVISPNIGQNVELEVKAFPFKISKMGIKKKRR